MEQALTLSDTIAAPATAPGGALTIIRLSGPQAVEIADRLWRGQRPLAEMAPNTAAHGRLHDNDGSELDEIIATVYRAPKSFTGQDSVELTLHGSPWIARAVMAALTAAGARPAGPGEFTQRAFLNGRIDLTRAEGIADLIASSSRASHRLAMAQTRGDFSRRFTALRERLIHIASMLELELDFGEEEVEFADRSELALLCVDTIKEIDSIAGSYATGRVLKEGVPVVIAGKPNAGKSTLLNALLGDDKAIVSAIPGTTRDTIEDTAEIDGILYRFIDTAGLRTDTADPIERMGIDRARAAMATARIILWLQDPADKSDPSDPSDLSDKSDKSDQSDLSDKSDKSDKSDQSDPSDKSDKSGRSDYHPTDAQTVIKILTKSDLYPDLKADSPWLKISAKDRTTLSALKARLKETVLAGQDPEQTLIITNARHHALLRRVSADLRRALEALQEGLSADLVSQDIRQATRHLGALVGTITPDDLLQTIFSRFCIGK